MNDKDLNICQLKEIILTKSLNNDLKLLELKIESVLNDIMIGISLANVQEKLNTTTITSGIYLIVNRSNGKWYVGSTTTFSGRWAEHIRKLRIKRHNNDYLQRSWDKYGPDEFLFIKLEEIEPIKSKLHEIENKYLSIAKNNQDTSFNLNFEATGGQLSDYSRDKISKSSTGTPKTITPLLKQSWEKLSKTMTIKMNTPEMKERLSIAHTGKKKSEQTKCRISEARKGMKFSESHINNLKLAQRKRYSKQD